MSSTPSSEAQQIPLVGRGGDVVDELEIGDRRNIGIMGSDIPEQPAFNGNRHQDDDQSEQDEEEELIDLHDQADHGIDLMDADHEEGEVAHDEGDQEGDQEGEGDHDDQSEDEEELLDVDEVAERFRAEGGAGRRGALAGVERMALNQFLQMIAGRMAGDNRQPARDNRELIQSLQQQGVLVSQNVINAFILVPRSMFVPQNYVNEALADNPIRVAQWEFNISAPHMHATCIEKLNLQHNQTFLDVGTGSGICAAIAALLVGPLGCVVAIDTKPVAVNFARENVQRLRRESAEYCDSACTVETHVHNVFMPFGAEIQVQTFDKIHVGAQCPEEKVGELLCLLNDDGMLIVPVKQELRLYTKRKGSNRPSIEVVNQVRFGEIEVPSDAQVVMRSIQIQRENSGRIEVPPSTYYQDLRTISSSFSSSPSSFYASSSPLSVLTQSPRPSDTSQNWVKRLRSACCIHSHDRENKSGGGNNNKFTQSSLSQTGLLKGQSSQPINIEEVRGLLGTQDIVLQGKNFELRAHRVLLRTRAGYFKSQYECGMSDREKDIVALPEHFQRADVACFVDYIYKDEVELQPQQALQVIEIANYFQVPRLLAICESVLATAMEADPVGACDSVCDLLVLADDNGLNSLRTASLNFIAHHFPEVKNTKGYEALQPRHLKMVNSQLYLMHTAFVEKLRQMSESRDATY